MPKVFYEPIPGTDKELVKHEPYIHILDFSDMGAKNILVVCDKLREYPLMVAELVSLYKDQVEISEVWKRLEVVRDPYGELVQKDSYESPTEPDNNYGFTHMLCFISADMNLLKFIEWDIKKKLGERTTLDDNQGSRKADSRVDRAVTQDLIPTKQPVKVDTCSTVVAEIQTMHALLDEQQPSEEEILRNIEVDEALRELVQSVREILTTRKNRRKPIIIRLMDLFKH